MNERKRYIVKAAWNGRDQPKTVVLETNNYEKAKSTANFWDERMDVEIIDQDRIPAADKIARKWDDLFDRINHDPEYGTAQVSV